jgi:cell division septum initiation protein DivIVA
MSTDHLDRDVDFPTAFRGYAREPVDGLLEEIEKSYRTLLAERDDLRARLADATARLERHVEQQQAIADALIEAERLKAAGEDEVRALKAEGAREIQELRSAAERDAEKIRREAELQAEAIVRDAETVKAGAAGEAEELLSDARARAARLVEETQQSLEERQHTAEEVLDAARIKLGSFVRDLFDQVGTAMQEQEPPVESAQGEG